jgi:hypothetical protein
MRLLKHPFPVQARVRDCRLSVVVAQISAMRPVGIPQPLGVRA